MSTVQEIALKTIDSRDASLGDFAGKVVLVVNVASKCGLTPQYEGLERLYDSYSDKGLVVAGFPANDFGAQEPGTNDEIAVFCTTNYGVSFPMFAKMQVTGRDKHPLYGALTSAIPEAAGEGADAFRETLRGYKITPTEFPEILWNFEKFLIGRDGTVVARFAPTTEPGAPELVAAIEAELAK